MSHVKTFAVWPLEKSQEGKGRKERERKEGERWMGGEGRGGEGRAYLKAINSVFELINQNLQEWSMDVETKNWPSEVILHSFTLFV
jgi:hypothetical protein